VETRRPTLRHGRSYLDLEVLPLDEFHERLAGFRALMASQRIEAAVVVGTPDQYAGLTYLSGYSPMNQPTTMLLHRDEREPVLLVVVARNVPYVSTLTWITDVRSYSSIGAGAATVFAEWNVSGPIGLVGVSNYLSAGLSQDTIAQLDKYRLIDLDDPYESMRRSKRARELTVLRRSAAIVDEAVSVAKQRFMSSSNAYTATLAAEGAGRVAGGRDVRALVYDPDDGTWRVPYARDHASEGMTWYLGVDVDGYWSETMMSFPTPRNDKAVAVEAAVEAMVRAAKPGETLGSIADAALGQLEQSDHAIALGVGLGSTIGLGHEHLIQPGSDWALEEGEVLSIHCFAGEGTASAASSKTVVVSGDGNVALGTSDW
jgi:Xaa-Pro aminopeptidase